MRLGIDPDSNPTEIILRVMKLARQDIEREGTGRPPQADKPSGERRSDFDLGRCPKTREIARPNCFLYRFAAFRYASP